MDEDAPSPDLAVRRADAEDAEAIGRLLHGFNSEYDEPTPGPEAIADRVEGLLVAGEITVLLGGANEGLAVLRFRPALMSEALDCYLEELYVVPDRRGKGLGRALMETAMDLARREGARDMHLGTSEDDLAARPSTRVWASTSARASQTVRSTTSTSGSCERAVRDPRALLLLYVPARAADELVASRAALQEVAAHSAEQVIIARSAEQRVGARSNT